MMRIAGSIIISIMVIASVFLAGCGCDDEEAPAVNTAVKVLPDIGDNASVEESGGSDDVGYLVARTDDGEHVNMVAITMDSPPSEDDLIMAVITSASEDARASGEEASFEITEASLATQPADPTIVVLVATESGEKVYAGWYCHADRSLVITSSTGDNLSFAANIECLDGTDSNWTATATTVPPSLQTSPEPSSFATITPSLPPETSDSSPVSTIKTLTPKPEEDTSQTGEITDDFAEVAGQFPQLLSDGDDATYVRGGIIAGDWVAKFTLSVEQSSQLAFLVRVNCISAGCNGSEVCGFIFMIKNQTTGMFEKLEGAPWEEPGIHEYQLYIENPVAYIENDMAEFKFSFECNMDGYVTEFRQIGN